MAKRYRSDRCCEVCGQVYEPTYGKQRTCSRRCGEIMRRTISGTLPDRWPSSRIYVRNCDQCSKLFTARHARAKRCSAECKRLAVNAYMNDRIKKRYAAEPAFRDKVIAAEHSRRVSKLGLDGGVEVLLSYLMRRDRRRCGICHKPVRATKGPMRPSSDHIVPLSKGGKHELANCQLAHYLCNLKKGNRGGGEQLMLIG